LNQFVPFASDDKCRFVLYADYRPEVASVDVSNPQPPHQASLATTGWQL